MTPITILWVNPTQPGTQLNWAGVVWPTNVTVSDTKTVKIVISFFEEMSQFHFENQQNACFERFQLILIAI